MEKKSNRRKKELKKKRELKKPELQFPGLKTSALKRPTKKNFELKEQILSVRGAAIGAGALAVLIIAAVSISWFSSSEGRAQAALQTAEGVAYIESLEQKSTEEIEAVISASEKEAAIAAMDSEDFNVWAHFGNIVMMGDSRTKEYAHSEFVEARRVLAEDGDSILNIANHLDELVDLNPEYIILQYGINDMENEDVWPTPEIYLQEFDKQIKSIQEVVPNACIFIQSILPCIEPELSRLACRREVPTWNEAIKAYCEEKGLGFIDVTDVADSHQEYYEPDGMHFIPSFYEFWAKRLIGEVMTYEK